MCDTVFCRCVWAREMSCASAACIFGGRGRGGWRKGGSSSGKPQGMAHVCTTVFQEPRPVTHWTTHGGGCLWLGAGCRRLPGRRLTCSHGGILRYLIVSVIRVLQRRTRQHHDAILSSIISSNRDPTSNKSCEAKVNSNKNARTLLATPRIEGGRPRAGARRRPTCRRGPTRATSQRMKARCKCALARFQRGTNEDTASDFSNLNNNSYRQDPPQFRPSPQPSQQPHQYKNLNPHRTCAHKARRREEGHGKATSTRITGRRLEHARRYDDHSILARNANQPSVSQLWQ